MKKEKKKLAETIIVLFFLPPILHIRIISVCVHVQNE